MNSSNPFFKNKKFTNTSKVEVLDNPDIMTISGTINKSLVLLGLVALAFAVTWYMTFNGYNPMVLTIGGAISGFVLVLITSFRPEYSKQLAPGYALCEGLFLGGISAIFELTSYAGIAMQAVSATMVTFVVCFMLYKYEVIKVTEKFKSVVISATIAIAAFYLISWLLSMFTSYQPVQYGNSWMSIGISIFVIVIASLNLFLDFDEIEKGAWNGNPKYMEWFSAMGLIITLVWLYVEFLRLLSKLNKN